MQRRHSHGEQEANQHTAERDAVGDDVELEIDERPDEQHRDEHAIRDHHEPAAVVLELTPDEKPERGVQEFNQPVPKRKLRATLVTLAAQRKKTDERNVVVPRDRRIAAPAVRAGADNGLIPRHPPDADVEKASPTCAEDEDHDAPEPGWYGLLQVTCHRPPCAMPCASLRRALSCPSRSRMPSRPGAATCSCRWRSCIPRDRRP